MKVPELRRRILFTLAMIVVVRLGVQIPLPGIDVMELQKVIEASANASGPGAGLATVLTIFSGGGLQQCGIFALGIMPYISASIMTQLLSAVVPQWAKMVREEGGRQKMTKWTRAIAIVIALVQGWFLVGTLEHPERLQAVGLNIPADCQLVIDPGIQFALMTVLIMVAGTMFLMWIGDQITERGVGNGVSLIISVNIIPALPGGSHPGLETPGVQGRYGCPHGSHAARGPDCFPDCCGGARRDGDAGPAAHSRAVRQTGHGQ